MPALGWPRAPQSSFLMRPGKGASCTGIAIFSVTCPRPRVREIAAMLKAIHAGEDIAAAREKAIRVIEKLRGLRLSRAAELVENGGRGDAHLLRLPRGALAADSHQQPARAHPARDPAAHPRRGRVS